MVEVFKYERIIWHQKKKEIKDLSKILLNLKLKHTSFAIDK